MLIPFYYIGDGLIKFIIYKLPAVSTLIFYLAIYEL